VAGFIFSITEGLMFFLVIYLIYNAEIIEQKIGAEY